MTCLRLADLRLHEVQMLSLSDAALLAHIRAAYFCDQRGTGYVMNSNDLARCYVRPAQRRELIERGVWGDVEDGRTMVRGLACTDTTGREVQVSENCVSNGVELHRALSGAERTRRWREKNTTVTDVTKAPSQNVTETQVGDEHEGGCDGLSVTETSAPPDPPQIHDLSLRSSPDPEASSSVLASDLNLLGSARDSEPRAKRKRTIEKPVPMTWDFRPPQSAWDVTLKKLDCVTADLERHLPDFRHYWIDGKGSGKNRSPRGWVQTWMSRMAWLAERGQLYMARGVMNSPSRELRPHEQANVDRLLRKYGNGSS